MNFFLTLLAGCSCFFLWSSHPVWGVLTLVGVGLAGSAWLVCVGHEFLGLAVVVVYVGAVTVLFVFVVMMVNLRAPQGGPLGVEAPLVWLGLAGLSWGPPGGDPRVTPAGPGPLGATLWGTHLLGGPTLVGGVLLVGMVSAICLSLTGGETYRSQEFYSQIRKPNGVFRLGSLLVGHPDGWVVLLAVGAGAAVAAGTPGTPGDPGGPRRPWWVKWVLLGALGVGVGVALYLGSTPPPPPPPGVDPDELVKFVDNLFASKVVKNPTSDQWPPK